MTITNSLGTLIIGLIIISAFVYKNPDKQYLKINCLFIFLLFLSDPIYEYLNQNVSYILWAVSSVGLVAAYGFRFHHKVEKSFIDYIKPLGILFLLIMPISFCGIFDLWGDTIFMTMNYSALLAPLLIFIYDRYILKLNMKKTFVIILGVQAVLLFGQFVYSFYQKTLAERNRMEMIEHFENSELLKSKLTECENKIKNC